MTKKQTTSSVLRAIRANINLTQEQLAARLGVSFATVNRWEGGSNEPQKAAREVIAALALEAGVGGEGDVAEPGEPAAAVTRRRRAASTSAPSTKSMEQMLWDAACSIRGEKDAPKFKDYLLPMVFLKRLSDVFDDEVARLAEDYGDRATALEIAEGDHSLLRFYMPPEARWGVISGRDPWPLDDQAPSSDEPSLQLQLDANAGRDATDWVLHSKKPSTKPKDIGEHLTKAVRAVVKQNPTLSGVIDIVDFAAERNGERDINPAKLRLVVETFSDPRYRLGLADVQPDFLGRAYEYLLRKFAEGSGQSAGEFFTPTEVGFLMAHIMRPRPGEDCHDYACGSAGLLVKLQLVARELDPTARVPLKLTGQELQAESYAVAQMNGIIHDMEIEIARGDTMINPKFRTNEGKVRGHDIVVANPMWNQPFAPDVFANDPFDRFRTTGGVTSGKGDWAWLQHTLACLNDRGRAAVVLDTGAVTRGSGSKHEDRERNIRKWFVDHDMIDGVILLPENLFYNTGAPGVIVVLSKQKTPARRGRITLFNASRRVKKGKPKNYIPDDAIRLIASAYLKGEPLDDEITVISSQQVADADYDLSPSRWVGHSPEALNRKLPDIILQLEDISKQQSDLDRKLSALFSPLKSDNGGGARGGIQKQSEFGLTPDSWPITAIGDFTTQTQYGLSVRGELQGQYPILRMNCQQDGKVLMRDLQYVDLEDRIASAYRVHSGDILFNRTNSYELVGRSAIVDEETNAVFASYLVRVTVDQSRLQPRYLNYFLNWSVAQSELKKLASRGVSQANISASKLRDFAIPVPPTVAEQVEIVAILDALRNKIALHQLQAVALDDLFKSMLHNLLSGDIRADELDTSILLPSENEKDGE